MRIHILLLLTTTWTVQVHSETFGSRIPGDYLLIQIDLPVNNSGYFRYPVGYPTAIRPEIISYIHTTPLRYDHLLSYVGGVNHAHYSQRLLRNISHSASVYGKPPEETFTIGSLSTDDKLLKMETYTKKPQPNKIIVLNLKYPKINSAATLSWLSVKDAMFNDTASVKVVKGGIGFKSVHLRLISRIGEGLNITVKMYGKNVTVDNWPWYVSYGAATDALLFKVYWVYDVLSLPSGKKYCGCKSGRLMTQREN